MNKNDGDKIVQLKAFPVPGYFAADLPQQNDGFTKEDDEQKAKRVRKRQTKCQSRDGVTSLSQ